VASQRQDLSGETGHESVIGGLEPALDAAPGDWIRAATAGPWQHVSSLLPTGYAAYARIFHPAYLYEEPTTVRGRPREDPVRWSAIAERNGRHAHPGMQWPAIIDATPGPAYVQPGLWNVAPNEGSLPRRETLRLLWTLDAHTTSPYSCWLAVWDGFGTLTPAIHESYPPRLKMPNRDMLLFSGPLHCAAASFADPSFGEHQSPSLWWPEDRAWCIATDVDLMTTYVGASAECVAQIVADGQLEAMSIDHNQETTWDSDTLNPAPAEEGA
jgi:hypothetical protein